MSLSRRPQGRNDRPQGRNDNYDNKRRDGRCDRSPDRGRNENYDNTRRDGRGDRGYRGDRGHSPDRKRRDDRRDDRRQDGGHDHRNDGGGRRDTGGRRDDGGRCDGGGRRRDRRGRAPTPYVDITCQICKIHAHPASECWWRYQDDSDDDGGDRDRKDAHAASYDIDTNWYSDTGAAHHLTSELNKLTTCDKYRGRDQIHTADGNGMKIAHIGHSSFLET